ncbi:hypothetical protein G7D50_003248 [Salmonella enterica]|nr:hypothetical protein [Salmonella enterica]EIR0417219.1 hypothetical protein [Salmonella enterica]ELU9034609.1 hypothetical protein [Salmonella enterica]
MPSNKEIFWLHYNYYMEVMIEIFTRRCNNTLLFLQFFLGGASFANSSYGWLIGTLIGFCAAVQYTWNPGKVSSDARQQSLRYKKVRDIVDTLTTEELVKKLQKLEQTDSTPLNSLNKPAYQRACISLGRSEKIKLTLVEKIISCIAGGTPGLGMR